MKYSRRKCIRFALPAVLCALAAVSAASQQRAEVVYVEGVVDLELANGRRTEAFFGDVLQSGDTIITGQTGRAELELVAGNTVRIDPDTVFSIQETVQGEDRRTVLATTVGSVRFRFEQLLEQEPILGTAAVSAGVRGTEVTVFSGVDGGSLFLVTSGLVAVRSQGQTVELGPQTAVEVLPAEPPGEPFEALEEDIDFSEWNNGRFDAFLRDPVASVGRLEQQLAVFIEEIADREEQRSRVESEIELRRERMAEIEAEEGLEARRDYFEEEVFPLQVESGNLRRAQRYYALSALSLRRYVLGRMYLIMKTSYIGQLEDPVFQRFLGAYDQFLDVYEGQITPYLVAADI
jgi:hypothetical protein